METIKSIVTRHRGSLSQDAFADIVSEALQPYRKIRRQHISSWENGVVPEIFSMVYIRDNTTGDLRKMAIEIINAIQNS